MISKRTSKNVQGTTRWLLTSLLLLFQKEKIDTLLWIESSIAGLINRQKYGLRWSEPTGGKGYSEQV